VFTEAGTRLNTDKNVHDATGPPVPNCRILSYLLHGRLHDGHLTDEEQEELVMKSEGKE